MDKDILYSIIIPCYKSSDTVGNVIEEATLAMNEMGKGNVEFVLVNDASPDGGATWDTISALSKKKRNVTAVDLAKNSGQHNAIMAGMHYAKGDIIISMDDDGQTDPYELHKMFQKMDEGYDIVWGYYPQKKESLFRRMGSAVNHLSFQLFTGKPKWLHTSSFWIIKRYVLEAVINYKGIYSQLQGLFLRTSDHVTCVPVRQRKRAAGTSGYSLKKLIGLWSNMLGFSVVPLRIAIVIGMILSAIGFIAAIVIVIRKIVNPVMAIGWASMFAGLCFFSGVILLFMGLIGEYVGRLYMGQNAAPQYVIRSVESSAPEEIRGEKESGEP